MQFYGKAESAAKRTLDAFKGGSLLDALAPVFIRRRDNVPCRAWSWSNQMLAALVGTSDADLGGSWRYIESYAGRKDQATIAVCERYLRRTCEAVALILDTADELAQAPMPESEVAA